MKLKQLQQDMFNGMVVKACDDAIAVLENEIAQLRAVRQRHGGD